MPSMFSRRRGSSATRQQRQPLDQSTTSNAALAASQAFLQRPPAQSGSLSSAAAAAALRSHTTTPEPVGSIQTKRMVRRGSMSSVGSGSFVGTTRGSFVGSSRPGMQRRDSQGSMTERTFRSPSPGGRLQGAASPDPHAPPVPAIPKTVQHKRSSSLDPPARVMSPTNNGKTTNGRAMSLDRSSQAYRPNARRPKNRLSDVNEEVERADANPSVNFSRPRTSQPSSPVSPTASKSYRHGTDNWYTESKVASAGSRQGVNATALEQKVARIQAAAGQAVKTDHSIGSAQGTHLGRSNQQTSSSQDDMETVMVFDPSSRTFVPQLRPKPTPTEPPSPTLPRAPAPAPGTYDPNTRRIVPEPKSLASQAPVAGQQRAAPPSLDTGFHPPPRNPARMSPVNTSYPGRQSQSKPLAVREEPEQEDDGSSVGTDLVDSGRFISTSVGPAKAYVVPVQKPRSSSLDVPRGEGASRGRGGSASPSPQRSARFSASPVVAAILHDPPARNVSPAKPALKHHSPASSVRTSSPMANFSSAPKSPVSEISDTASQASQDASGRKKKSVRVSFDEQAHPIEANTAASTPAVIRSSVLDDDDDEDMMKPRPALPSFGSVRKQRSPQIAEKVTEMAPERHESSNDHAIGGILRNANESKRIGEPVPPEVTSKVSAGYVSDESEDLTSPVATSTPAVNPADSSVENPASSSSAPPKVIDFAAAKGDSKTDTLDVPDINLLPPTPGVEEEERVLGSESGQHPRARTSVEINLPGSWDKEDERHDGGAAATAAKLGGETALETTDEEPIIYSSPASKSPLLAAIDEDTDTDAEFSDAAEDLSELDNGGYASLNAIAVSPVAKPSPAEPPKTAPVSPPESPSIQQASKKHERLVSEAAGGSGDWSQATAYWSKLSKQQREQIEREHFSSDDETYPPAAATRKTKKKAIAKPTMAGTAESPAPVAATQTSSQAGKPAPAAGTTMKKSMRAQPSPTPVGDQSHLRQSMRDGNTTKLSSTLRSGPPSKQQQAPERKAGFTQKTMRPASSSSLPGSATDTAGVRDRDPSTTQGPLHTRAQAQSKSSPAPAMTARLQRELSHDSDSESSFKKKRRSAAKNASGSINMKRSMRGGPAQDSSSVREERPVSPTPARGKGRDSFSIRSLSPTGSLFGRKKQVENVRQSLRGNSVDAGPRMTLRNGPPNKATSKPAQPTSTASRFKSRFVDSDDDDDDPKPSRGAFRSRFVDSDDEDDDVLTPVRGIPKRYGQNDGDSTDLEDEDDDAIRKTHQQREKFSTPMVPDTADVDAAMEIARKKLGIAERPPQDTNEGASLQKGSLRTSESGNKPAVSSVETTPEKRRRGFMGSILRRNRGSTASVQTVNSPLRNQVEASQIPASPAIETTTQSPQTTARPQSPIPVSPQGKLMRRTSAQTAPRLRRGDSSYSTATAPPAVGESDLRGDWPLPAVPKIPEQYEARPNTSDGSPLKTGRAASVRFEDHPDVYSARTGKKKKFGMLRRAFGLND